MDQRAARRRPVLKAALGGVAAAGAVSGAVRWWPDEPDGTGGRTGLVLSGDASDQVSEVEVLLDSTRMARRVGGSRWTTQELATSSYSMLALTWDDPRVSPALEVRTRARGTWSGWRPVPTLHDVPDRGTDETTSRGASDLFWIGPSDGVQVRGADDRPRGLRLLLLRPWVLDDDSVDDVLDGGALRAGPSARSALGAARVPRPDVRGRRHWNAKESWRDGQPRYNRTIQQVHVHHTAGSNDYGRHDVPAILRGIYRYHTHYLGWSDIGYNFLVDRFGRTWTGRAGGASRAVRGAHTLGFNATSTGISVIGNFETAKPSSAVLDAIAAVAAWKLRSYGRDPEGLVRVWSEGSDKYRRGRTVSLPVIDGHRNTNDTACPGTHLYQAIPEIRRRTRDLIRWYSKVHVLERPSLTGEPVLGGTLSVQGGGYTPADAQPSYVWLRDGKRIKDAEGPRYDVRPADAGARLSVRVVVRKRGLKPVKRTLWSSRRVRVPVALYLVPHARGDGRLRVDVRVEAPAGVVVPHGEVVVKVGSRRAVVDLEAGHGVARFGWSTALERGRYRVHAAYDGDRAHEPARAAIRTRVR